MRHLGFTLAATLVAATLSGCGKPNAGGQPSAAASAGPPAAAAAPSEADRKALQAALPAPYATADLARGEAQFALCAACHTVTPGGPNMTGPNLHGVFGRKAASTPSFAYSDALKATGITWDAAQIDRWIADPKLVAPGTKMTFAGMKDAKDRTDLIAFLMVDSGFKP